MINVLYQKALEFGFDEVKELDIKTLKPMDMVRNMCASDKCHAYGKNWTCPPECGTLEQCHAQMQSYQKGLLLQTVGHLKKLIDGRTMSEAEKRHLQNFYSFAEFVRELYPDALCLGAGGCRICRKCAYPDPCRFPEKACSSMEGYGLFVTQVCKDNGLPYYHGEKTITYTACVLFGKKED